jgi:hypothetical protein
MVSWKDSAFNGRCFHGVGKYRSAILARGNRRGSLFPDGKIKARIDSLLVNFQDIFQVVVKDVKEERVG